MAEAVNGNGWTRYNAIAAILGAGGAMMFAIFTLWATANTAASVAHDLKDQVRILEGQVAADRIEIAGLKYTQIEADTQLRASIDEANKSLAWNMRIESMLWTKAGLPHLPTDNSTYPNIANGQSR